MRHEPNSCRVCAAIKASPGLSNVQVALAAGTSEASIRRHKQPAQAADFLGEADNFFTEVPEAIITSRGRSVRLPDGSWEKITYRPQDLAIFNALQYQDVEQAIADYEFTPTEPVQNRETAVLCLADWQIGKTGTEGGTRETVQRVLNATEAFCNGLRNAPAEEVILADLGDILENFDNTGSQRATNDHDLTTQLRIARRLMIDVLKRVRSAASGSKMVLMSVPSNHCQVRLPGGKDLASTPNNDWGIELSHQIEDVFDSRPEWSGLTFVRTQEYEEAITHTTPSGIVIGAVHGHQAKAPDRMGEWWKGQSHGRRCNLHNADILMHGHWHSTRITQSGDQRWIIGTPSVDPGSPWFTNKTGESATSGMLSFRVNENGWSNLRIL